MSEQQHSVKEHLELARALAQVAREQGLAEIDYRHEGMRIHLVVDTGEAPAGILPETFRAAAPARAAVRQEAESASENLRAVCSPLAGVFYRSPSPGSPPFAGVGDRISVGQTLCIIEAMKLMNEIGAETAGIIRKVLVENAAVVESGQKLFLIEPLG